MITILLQKILAALTQLLGDIKTKLNTIKDNLDNLIVVATASGPIASFTTTITKPFISFIVDIPESESGTDTVIVTQTKKNLVFSKIDATVDASGVIISSSNYYKLCIAKVAQGQTYTVTTSDTQLVCGFFTDIPSIGDTTYNNSRTIQASKTFTAPITGYVGFRAIYDGDYQCEVGNQATTYEPYTATTKTVSLPSTVYGGEVDVISGKITKTYEADDLGVMSWSYESDEGYFYSDSITDIKSGSENCLCESGYTYDAALSVNKTFNVSGTQIRFRDDTYSAAPDFKTAVTGIDFIYELAEADTDSITPEVITALNGVNNIFSDSGDVNVEYLKLYKED